MEKMKKVEVTIIVEFGSDFQRDFYYKMLSAMLDTLKLHMERSHRLNSVNYSIKTDTGMTISNISNK